MTFSLFIFALFLLLYIYMCVYVCMYTCKLLPIRLLYELEFLAIVTLLPHNVICHTLKTRL